VSAVFLATTGPYAFAVDAAVSAIFWRCWSGIRSQVRLALSAAAMASLILMAD
jgi:hypothetical protein